MKIRNIIKNAETSIDYSGVIMYDDDWVEFIRTFDPEHVELMEAVVTAARVAVSALREDFPDFIRVEYKYLMEHVEVLDAYRSEHRLES